MFRMFRIEILKEELKRIVSMMMSLSVIILLYYGILDMAMNSQGKRYFSTIFNFIYTIFHFTKFNYSIISGKSVFSKFYFLF